MKPLKINRRMRSTGHSSARFGPCEVCGGHASDVWIERALAVYEDENGEQFESYRGAPGITFGHRGCFVRRAQ